MTDGLVPIDWSAVKRDIEDHRAQGKLLQTGLRHGHTFMQLCDIRGYEALMFDMADGEPRLRRLIGLLEDFNLALVERYLAAGAEWMSFPEDLGMQIGPMLSPGHFREVHQSELPAAHARRRWTRAASSTCTPTATSARWWTICWTAGVEVVNLQDLVNGIDWIAGRFAGKVCIDLDIDRQNVTSSARPREIDALIREEVDTAGSAGGRADDDLRPVPRRAARKRPGAHGRDGAVRRAVTAPSPAPSGRPRRYRSMAMFWPRIRVK